MHLTNQNLNNFIRRIKLKRENMSKYREQVDNLITKLEGKIKEDDNTGAKVTRVLKAGSWKKGTILRPTGDNPIDMDLVFFVEGDESLGKDLKKLHDFIVSYLESIYPTKDIARDVDAEGNTKSITITFKSTGLEVDVVPVVPLDSPPSFVWQPERGGTGRYITSVDGQLGFASTRKKENTSFTSIVRAIKWWRNYKELNDELSSFAIELIVSHLDMVQGVETNIQEGIIRFFEFMSSGIVGSITFPEAIKSVPTYDTEIYIGDPTNNENNVAKKIYSSQWIEIENECLEAFESLNIALSTKTEGGTVEEWKAVFGPSFNITEED